MAWATQNARGTSFSWRDYELLRDRRDLFEGSGAAIRERYRRLVHRIIRSLYGLDVPLIAAVNGPAMGLGCGIAGTAAADIGEGEIGHDRAGRADLVAIIEVIDVGRIEIHGLLHAAQAERVGEELVVLPCIGSHGCDVV